MITALAFFPNNIKIFYFEKFKQYFLKNLMMKIEINNENIY